MYKLNSTTLFVRKSKKFVINSEKNRKKLEETLNTMVENPFSRGLKTHTVNSKNFGTRFSSRVTGDIRIIWRFDENDNIVILLLDIGGHSGKNSVY